MKRCNACNMEKALDEFPSYMNGRNGKLTYHPQCKPCYNELHRRWRKNQGERYRKQQRDRFHERLAKKSQQELKEFRKNQCRMAKRRHEENKKLVFEAYGGAICNCCGETQPEFLSIDHINNDGAEHRREIGNSGSRIYQWLRIHNFPEGFQVLCMNCQTGKRINNGVCPHQERCNDYPRSGSRAKSLEAQRIPMWMMI